MNIDSSNPTDIEYMNHLKWPQLVVKAAAVYKVMEDNNEKYNFIELHSVSYWEQKYRDKYRN